MPAAFDLASRIAPWDDTDFVPYDNGPLLTGVTTSYVSHAPPLLFSLRF